MKRWLFPIIPLAGLLAVAALFWLFALQKTSTRVEPNFTIGKPMPEIIAPHLIGGPPVALSDQIDGPVVVNLFASWCAPCVVEMPYLLEMQERGVRIIGLAQRDAPEDTARFLNRYGNPYDVILNDSQSRGTLEFGATGVPETYLIDADGVIIKKHTSNFYNEEQIADFVAAYQAAGGDS